MSDLSEKQAKLKELIRQTEAELKELNDGYTNTPSELPLIAVYSIVPIAVMTVIAYIIKWLLNN